MTKVDAIKRVMQDNGGTATWDIIYDNIEKYYPSAKTSREWKAGIRGVLYRELKSKRNFKKIGLGIFALADYEEKPEKIREKDVVRMHSFIQGICLELGNFENFDTFTADPSALFKDNIYLNNLTTLKQLPNFTYDEIVTTSRRIDVLWFNKKGFKFPKRAFEVVHSIGTLGDALNRIFQLYEFNLDFYIIGRKEHRGKFEDAIKREPYNRLEGRYKYRNYGEMIEYYELEVQKQNMSLFK